MIQSSETLLKAKWNFAVKLKLKQRNCIDTATFRTLDYLDKMMEKIENKRELLLSRPKDNNQGLSTCRHFKSYDVTSYNSWYMDNSMTSYHLNKLYNPSVRLLWQIFRQHLFKGSTKCRKCSLMRAKKPSWKLKSNKTSKRQWNAYNDGKFKLHWLVVPAKT